MVNEACLKMLDTYKVLHIGVSLNYREASEMARAKLILSLFMELKLNILDLVTDYQVLRLFT
jgi:hypothetical protein